MHDLGGTFRETWTADGALRPWIENPGFLGPLKDKVYVLSFGYNANRFGEVANTRIIHYANSPLRALFRKRIDCQVGHLFLSSWRLQQLSNRGPFKKRPIILLGI